MKALKSLAAGIACLSLVMALSSCPSPADPAAPPTTTASNNAFLSNLTVKVGNTTSDIGFQATTYAYTYNVATDVASVTVNAVLADHEADFEGGGVVTLNAAGQSTAVPIVVTAADGTTKKTYTVTIKRAAAGASSIASLSDLSVTLVGSTANLIAFDADEFTFDAGERPYSFSVVNISATATDSGASISGTGDIPLSVGENTLHIYVTAADGVAYRHYTITVTRYGQESSRLASLTASGLSFSFDPYVTSYTLNAPNSLASTTIAASAEYSGSTVTIDTGTGFGVYSSSQAIALAAGATKTITLRVSSEFSSTDRDYVLAITRADTGAASVADLESLTIYGGDSQAISPAFSATTTAYTRSVPSNVTEMSVIALAVEGATVVSGTGDHDLMVGANKIDVVVVAADGQTTKTYTITVTRAAPPTISITSPAAGSTVNAAAGDLVVTGTYSDPNGEITGIVGIFGMAEVDATFGNGSYSISFPSSGLVTGETTLLVEAGNESSYNATANRVVVIENGLEGRTVTMDIVLADGLSSVDGYLTVALSEEVYLVHDLPLSGISFPYSLTIPGVADRDEKYECSVFITSGGFIDYITGGDSVGKYSGLINVSVNGADVNAGTVYLGSDSDD